jgi:type VI secretion system secreted protein Hcp
MRASAISALHPPILFFRVHDEALRHKGALQMAAVDYFLKLDGIDGETKQKGHEKEIELESWSFGETNHGTFSAGGGGGAGKVSMQDFHFVMQVNKASPKLFLACASGQHIKSAKLTCRKAGETQQEFLKVSFSDLLVSSYQTSGSARPAAVPAAVSFRPTRSRSISPRSKSSTPSRAPTASSQHPSRRVTT